MKIQYILWVVITNAYVFMKKCQFGKCLKISNTLFHFIPQISYCRIQEEIFTYCDSFIPYFFRLTFAYDAIVS